MVEPRSILRIKVEKGELCWSDINFEAKSQTNPAFAQWASDLMAKKGYPDKIISAGIGKALNLSKTLYINKSPADLEFLIFRWSVESHTFVTAWGEFFPTLEDVVVLTGLPFLGEAKAVVLPENSEGMMDDEAKRG